MSFGITASSTTGLSAGSGNSAYSTAVMEDNPLLFLQFDETSGTAAADSSGNGHDGTYVNSVMLGNRSVVPGSSGKSAQFENPTVPDDNRVTVPYGAWMNVGELTVAFPCFLVGGSYRLLASRYNEPGNDWSWFVYVNAGTVQFHYRSSGGVNTNIDTGYVIEPGKRYYVAAYVNASESGVRIYDQTGLLAQATGAGGTVNSSNRAITLANAESGNYNATMYMDEFAVFDTALSTARLDTLANLALVANPKWINRSTGVATRNGTTNHTINFTPASAGSFLVAIVATPNTTNTAVTAGWTERLQPTFSAELSVFTRSANAGDATLVIGHANSNYPMAYIVYEFPSGSSWITGTSEANSISFDPLTGLPGTPVTLLTAVAVLMTTPGEPDKGMLWRYFWQSDTTINEQSDGVTPGVMLNTGYLDAYTDTSATLSGPADFISIGPGTGETVFFAISVP